MRRTRIVATIGPASDSPEVLDRLIEAGLDVARLNASHGDIAERDRRLHAVRAAAERAGKHVAVLLDLSGPKLRIGTMEPGVILESGQHFTLVPGECEGDSGRACVSYTDLSHDVHEGNRLLLDDGRVELKVVGATDGQVETEVTIGGPLTSRKGLNVPGVTLAIDPITEKDVRDLEWGLEAGVDLIAQSFVRDANDVRRLRERMGDRVVPIIAKVEKHEAIAHIPDIVETADAVMVARGDLGVETSPETVPVVQKRLIEECRAAGKPVIIATQMLESMTKSTRPSRAEANDVANAIFDGVDAVMLSEETAVGAYPVETVQTMSRIIVTAEESMQDTPMWPTHIAAMDDVTAAVSSAAVHMAEDLSARAIVTATQSGASARSVARNRPRVPVFAVTPEADIARQLKLVWGVFPVVVPRPDTFDDLLASAVDALCDAGSVETDELVVFTAGVAVNQPGATNLIKVHRVT